MATSGRPPPAALLAKCVARLRLAGLCGPARNLARGLVRGEVVVTLQIQPELGRSVEGLGKEPGRLGRDAALRLDDLVDALQRNLQVRGQAHLRDVQRLEKLIEQNLSRVCGNAVAG